MKLTPQLDRLISIIAEAKTHFILACACSANSPERLREVTDVRRLTQLARSLLPEIGGFEKLPRPIAIELRVCVMGADKLSPTFEVS